ncbi:MAG: FAD-dependent monooxygenase, partial [Gammaproteobacteria bacterium]|nr:FAD-dependent monooxygenase [Gammaproteobacteria bacterium]
YKRNDDMAHLKLDNGQSVKTRLLVAADGGQSSVRTLCNIEVKQREYHQSAVIANISCSHPQAHTAYERFTPQGPLALLPMGVERYSLVWTHNQRDVEAVMALPDTDFLQQLQQAFGNRLGQLIKTGKREAYPLRLTQACEQIRPRIALIGNAAHTLHPIAGQGFNLGLRDVATLAQVIVDARHNDQDIGSLETLKQYAQWRQKDQNHIITLTDTLVRLFSNRFKPLSLARNLGLIGMDLLPPLKRQFSKHTMGVAGRLPRLARGLPL